MEDPCPGRDDAQPHLIKIIRIEGVLCNVCEMCGEVDEICEEPTP